MVDKKGGINSTAVGIAGAVVGAAVGAAAVALSDKKTRSKVAKQLDHLKGLAKDQMKEIQSGLEEMRKDASEKISEGVEDVKKIATPTKKGKKS